MAANPSGQAPREVLAGRPAPAGGVPPKAAGQEPPQRAGDAPVRGKERRHPAVRWIVHGVLFVALAVGVFGLLPRIGGLEHDATGLRHANPAFVVAAVLAQAVSLGCYAAESQFLRHRPLNESLAGTYMSIAGRCWTTLAVPASAGVDKHLRLSEMPWCAELNGRECLSCSSQRPPH